MFYNPPPLEGNWFGMALNVPDPWWRCANRVDGVNGAKFSLWRAPRAPLWTLLVWRYQWKESSESLNKSGGGEGTLWNSFQWCSFWIYEPLPCKFTKHESEAQAGIQPFLLGSITSWYYSSKQKDEQHKCLLFMLKIEKQITILSTTLNEWMNEWKNHANAHINLIGPQATESSYLCVAHHCTRHLQSQTQLTLLFPHKVFFFIPQLSGT